MGISFRGKLFIFSHIGDSRNTLNKLADHFKGMSKEEAKYNKNKFFVDLQNKLAVIAAQSSRAGVHLYSDAFFIYFNVENNYLQEE